MKKVLQKILVISVVLVISFSCSKDEEGEPYSQIEKDINTLVNQHRASIGKSALTLNTTIYNEAKGHSNNMAAGTVPYGHDGYTERFSRIQKSFGGTFFAENVAMGTKVTAKTVVDTWLASPTHKENIEGDFNYTAIGVSVSSSNISYCTQIFIKK
jgi:uncharacterized protein YkwD